MVLVLLSVLGALALSDARVRRMVIGAVAEALLVAFACEGTGCCREHSDANCGKSGQLHLITLELLL